MKNDLLFLLDRFWGFLLSAAIAALSVAVMYLDINVFKTAASESSLTEALQEVLLLLIAVMYWNMSRSDKSMRPAFVLVSGFFMCMLIRELDVWFDNTAMHWLPLALFTAALAIFYAVRHLPQTLRGLVKFTNSQPFILLMAGLITILVFSRLFGMKALWIGLLGEDYPRWVKIYAEEGLELFGYAQCFLATVFYAVTEHRKARKAQSLPLVELPCSEATERITS